MKKICAVCNDEFAGHYKSKYCSSQCREEAFTKRNKEYYSEVLLPDPSKVYKFQLSNATGAKWHYRSN